MQFTKKKTSCEECMYFEYDEEYDNYVCILSFDEDDTDRFLSGFSCPYFRFGDEYTIVRKQN